MKLLEHIFGTPLAAPETTGLKSLRFAMTGVMLLFSVGLYFFKGFDALGHVLAGISMFVLMVLGASLGIMWLRVKMRADDAWLEQIMAQTAPPEAGEGVSADAGSPHHLGCPLQGAVTVLDIRS